MSEDSHRARGRRRRSGLAGRRLVTAVALAAIAGTAGCSGSASTSASPVPGQPASSATPAPAGPAAASSPAPSGPSSSSPPSTPAAPGSTPGLAQGPELPRGGRTVFPAYRLVGFSGAPGSPAFGRLGVGDLDDRARELEKQAEAYAEDRQVLPVFELIATVANASPGRDGQYRSRSDDDTVREYLDLARAHKGLLLLGIQPGRADFLPEVKAYEKWLREPDVGLALDPEWAVGAGQVPGNQYGTTTGKELDAVAAYVSGLVAEHGLPEKVLVFHQLAPQIVRDERSLRPHEGVALVKSVDGIGSKELKLATWRRLTEDLAEHVHPGFKLFYEEDVRGGAKLMTPREVLAIRPTPEYVLYE